MAHGFAGDHVGGHTSPMHFEASAVVLIFQVPEEIIIDDAADNLKVPARARRSDDPSATGDEIVACARWLACAISAGWLACAINAGMRRSNDNISKHAVGEIVDRHVKGVDDDIANAAIATLRGRRDLLVDDDCAVREIDGLIRLSADCDRLSVYDQIPDLGASGRSRAADSRSLRRQGISGDGIPADAKIEIGHGSFGLASIPLTYRRSNSNFSGKQTGQVHVELRRFQCSARTRQAAGVRDSGVDPEIWD